MQALSRHPFRQALQAYLRVRDGAVDPTKTREARHEVIRTVPKKGKWYLCEVEGRGYAVRISSMDRIEIMHNIFDQACSVALSRR